MGSPKLALGAPRAASETSLAQPIGALTSELTDCSPAPVSLSNRPAADNNVLSGEAQHWPSKYGARNHSSARKGLQSLHRRQSFELKKLANVILISSLIVLHLCYLATIFGLPLLPPSNYAGSTFEINDPIWNQTPIDHQNANPNPTPQRNHLGVPPGHAHHQLPRPTRKHSNRDPATTGANIENSPLDADETDPNPYSYSTPIPTPETETELETKLAFGAQPETKPETNNQNSIPTQTQTQTQTQTPNQNQNSNDDADDLDNNSVVQQNENWLLQSEPARRELARYLFYEFYQKNFTDTLESGSGFESAAGLAETGAGPASSSSGGLFSGSPAVGVASAAAGLGVAGLNSSAAVAMAHDRLAVGVETAAAAAVGATNASQGRPYFGDAFYSFQNVYWPIHCVICLAICTLGIFANVTNIIVLTRPNMITAVNTILSAMAFSDLIVNISNIPYLMHELSDASNVTSFFSFQWALYILFHAHTTVTAHTISIWLTCVLATWRYFVVCRSQSANQRNWSVSLAKRTIVAVFLFVPIFCIPNYLSFAIVKEVTESNVTIYKVGFSHLADESQLIKTFHFWIFSCLTKLLPCVLLTFFTTVLIRKLLNARERRLRLATFGNAHQNSSTKLSIPNGGPQQTQTRGSHGELGGPLINGCSKQKDSFATSRNYATSNADSAPISANDLDNHRAGQRRNIRIQEDDERTTARLSASNAPEPEAGPGQEGCTLLVASERYLANRKASERKASQACQQSGSSCATDAEMIATSCNSSNSSGVNLNAAEPSTGSSNVGCTSEQPPTTNSTLSTRILSQLIVESSTNATSQTTTISTSTAPTKIMASCDSGSNKHAIHNHHCLVPSAALDQQSARSASTCGGLELYGKSAERGDKMILVRDDNQHLVGNSPLMNSQDLGPLIGSRSSLVQSAGSNKNGALGVRRSLAGANSATNLSGSQMIGDKRSSETLFGPGRARSVGSGTLVPMQMVKLQAAQRQLSQNETTTRLLIAVMIVFLICEFPAGILAALCAILGQDFFENVYQPTGILTDLLALINSSVNFVLYCLMSTQFRITFYRVVLHCPAPNAPQHTQAMLVGNNQQQ